MPKSQIVEIAFDISNDGELDVLLYYLDKIKIPYYIEPQNVFESLEELEAQYDGIERKQALKDLAAYDQEIGITKNENDFVAF